MKTFRLLAFALLLLSLFAGCGDQYQLPSGPKPVTPSGPAESDTLKYSLSAFPAQADPHVIGWRVVDHFIRSKHSNWGDMTKIPSSLITYPDVCAWLGGLWFAETTHDDELYNRLVAKFDLLFTTEKNLVPSLPRTEANKVDYYVFGAIPLLIYTRKKEAKYLELGLRYADGQWELPSNPSDTERNWASQGYSWQTRLWIDDMFMITALQAQAYLATGDEKYLERTVKEMVLYLERIQLSNGMFYHSPSARFLWARGNGWMAVGMAEILRLIPDGEKYASYRRTIRAAYQSMMTTLLQTQKSSGMWGQLVDDSEAWAETSGTGMFTYSMAYGVKKGILNKELYGEAVRKAYLELITYLTADYDLKDVCEGTGTGTTRQYYLGRRRLTGDLHGQAALIWTCNILCQ